MRRSDVRRLAPVLEDLEGRHLQSGMVAAAQADSTAMLLPYIEQENIFKVAPARPPIGGGPDQIIAILIG